MTTSLGLDIGTSSVKAVLVGDGEKILATASASLEVSRPHAGWSEQDGDSWITATQSAIDQLKSSHPKELSAVAGIGLSGQMHGATLLDAADNVLRPCILWNDTRSHKEAAELDVEPALQRRRHLPVEPLDGADEAAEIEHLARDHERLRHLGEARARLLHRPVRERDAPAVDDGVRDPVRDDLPAQRMAPQGLGEAAQRGGEVGGELGLEPRVVGHGRGEQRVLQRHLRVGHEHGELRRGEAAPVLGPAVHLGGAGQRL